MYYCESSPRQTHHAPGIDVAYVCGNTWSALDIVQCELADPWVEFEEEGQRLANPSRCTQDGNFRSLDEHNKSQYMVMAFAMSTMLYSRWRQ